MIRYITIRYAETLVDGCILGIEHNAIYADTLLNQQVLGRCIFGIVYNAKNADTLLNQQVLGDAYLALYTMPNMPTHF